MLHFDFGFYLHLGCTPRRALVHLLYLIPITVNISEQFGKCQTETETIRHIQDVEESSPKRIFL